MRAVSCVGFDTAARSSGIHLDKNENPFDTPPGLIEELRMSLSAVELNRYPDQEAAALKSALSEYCGFPSDWISVGNGGGEILLQLMMAFVPRNGCMMTLSPSFSGYEHLSRALGVRIREISLEFDGVSVDPGEERLFDGLAASSPDLIIIDRPNNPTGLSVRIGLLKEIARLTRGVLVVDEAYVEFGGGSFLSVPEELPSNVFVLRTFSKAWGLAGLRVGWGVSRPELGMRLDQVRSPFNLGTLPQEAARVALGYSEWMQARVKGIAYTRDRFVEEVNRLQAWTALPSSGNFVMLYSKCPGDLAAETFKKIGIHVRFPFMGALSAVPGSWVRVTVGKEEEMGLVLEVLKDLSYRL